MKTNLTSLLSTIVSYQLGYNRLNDVLLGDERVYTLKIIERKDSTGATEEKIALVSDKNVEYMVTVAQLAHLRIAVDGNPIAAKWLDDFRTDPNGSTFHKVAQDMAAANENLGDISFKVVANIKIRNNSVSIPDVPVYHDRCYKGAADYMRAVRNLLKDKDKSFFATPEYRYGIRALRDELYCTSLKPGMEVDANHVKLPVFCVISK